MVIGRLAQRYIYRKMKTDLRKFHRRIRRCKKCVDILGAKVLPRSGFPPDNSYKVVVVGAEPGRKLKV
jgi:uracil-DNA glycosylase